MHTWLGSCHLTGTILLGDNLKSIHQNIMESMQQTRFHKILLLIEIVSLSKWLLAYNVYRFYRYTFSLHLSFTFGLYVSICKHFFRIECMCLICKHCLALTRFLSNCKHSFRLIHFSTCKLPLRLTCFLFVSVPVGLLYFWAFLQNCIYMFYFSEFH